METSRSGGLQIAQREAFVLVWYQDGKHPSGGLGVNDPEATLGAAIAEEYAWTRFEQALTLRDVSLTKMLDKAGVILKQHEFDALMSLFYQAGSDNAGTVIWAMTQLDWRQDAGKQLDAFLKGQDPDSLRLALTWMRQAENAKKEFLEGLLFRRVRELNLLFNAEYGDVTWVKRWDVDPHKNPKAWTRYEVPAWALERRS